MHSQPYLYRKREERILGISKKTIKYLFLTFTILFVILFSFTAYWTVKKLCVKMDEQLSAEAAEYGSEYIPEIAYYGDVMISAEIKDALCLLVDDAAEDSIVLTIVEGIPQKNGGTSDEWETGLIVGFGDKNGGEIDEVSYEYEWLIKHCAEYGFIQYNSDSCCDFRYVGSITARVNK